MNDQVGFFLIGSSSSSGRTRFLLKISLKSIVNWLFRGRKGIFNCLWMYARMEVNRTDSLFWGRKEMSCVSLAKDISYVCTFLGDYRWECLGGFVLLFASLPGVKLLRLDDLDCRLFSNRLDDLALCNIYWNLLIFVFIFGNGLGGNSNNNGVEQF